MLRDHLVYGISDETIQKLLLAESKLTFKKAVELAWGLETADKNVKLLKSSVQEVQSTANSSEVHQGFFTQEGVKYIYLLQMWEGWTYFFCAGIAKTFNCRGCGKPGHLQKACRISKQGQQIGRVEEGDNEVEETSLFQVKSWSKTPTIEVQLQIDNCGVKKEVDTGATMSLMLAETFGKLWPRRSLETTKVILCSYSKEPIPTHCWSV